VDAVELIEKLETWKPIKSDLSKSQGQEASKILAELLGKEENIVLLKEKLKLKHNIQRALLRILLKQCVDLLSNKTLGLDDQPLASDQNKVHLRELVEILARSEKRDSDVKWKSVSVLLNVQARGALRVFYELLADIGPKEIQMVYQKNIYPGVNPDGGLPNLLDLILEGREYDILWLYKCINWVVERVCGQETVNTFTITRLEDYFRQKPNPDARLKSLYTLLAKVIDGNHSQYLKEYANALWESWGQSETEIWMVEFRLLGDVLNKPTIVNEAGNQILQSIEGGQCLETLNNGMKDDCSSLTKKFAEVSDPANADIGLTVPFLTDEPVSRQKDHHLVGLIIGGRDKNSSHPEGEESFGGGKQQRTVVKPHLNNTNKEGTSSGGFTSTGRNPVNSLRSLIGSLNREITEVEEQLIRGDELAGEVKVLHAKLRDGQNRFDEMDRDLEKARKRISSLEKENIEKEESLQELYDVKERREKDARLAIMEAEYAVANFRQRLWGLLEPNLFEALNESIKLEDLSINEQILLVKLRQILEVLRNEQITS